MKKLLLSLLFLSVYISGFAQFDGLIVENYGTTYKVDNPDLSFDTNKKHKVVFDIYSDSDKVEKTNALLENVAQYINTSLDQGVAKDSLNVVVVLHGKATKDILDDMAFKRLYKTENPNIEVIKALSDAGVEILVGGQSFMGNAFNRDEKLSEAKLVISAATVLVWYQSAGYQVINFN